MKKLFCLFVLLPSLSALYGIDAAGKIQLLDSSWKKVTFIIPTKTLTAELSFPKIQESVI